MNIYPDIEMEKDIICIKMLYNKCSELYKFFNINFNNSNLQFKYRLKFAVNQFECLFYKNHFK